MQDNPGSQKANSNHYASGYPGWIAVGTETIDRNQGDKCSTE
jgi:hypothetical protein